MVTTNNTVGSSSLSSRDREGLDFYQTPSYATRTLLGRFDFGEGRLWEPMCGNGMIAAELKAAGHGVYCTDLVQREYPLDATADFFDLAGPPGGEDFAVVTNPPYGRTDEFLAHALGVLRPRALCVFLPVRYLEGAKRWKTVYSRFRPSKVLVYSQRIGCFRQSDVDAGKVGPRGVASAVAYMWMCFRRGEWDRPGQQTALDWIP